MAAILQLLGGIACAFIGGELFLKGVVGMSEWFRIPKAVTAATLAAFATSSPEISVAVTSATTGQPQIALGDALGSNVVNIGLVIGVLLLLGPVRFDWVKYKREFITALFTPLLLLGLLADGVLSRMDATIMLAVFAVWMVRVIVDAIRERDKSETTVTGHGAMTAGIQSCVGLTALILAGRLIVSGGVSLGEAMGVSPFLVGVTVVAFGTSAPELATAVISKLRGHEEVGIGTVLGSNIFNCLFIVGLAGAIHPIVQSVTSLLPSLGFGILTVLALTPFGSSELGRGRAFILLALYIGSILAAASGGASHSLHNEEQNGPEKPSDGTATSSTGAQSTAPDTESGLDSSDQAIEEEAFAMSLEAYLYGYPRVELARRMHQETHWISEEQTICAPVNQFYFFGRLARPGDGRAIKAPNNDTLYASAYLDLMEGPIVLRVPDMGQRVYVALLVDAMGSVVQRLSSSASGPGGVDYVFFGPEAGTAPPATMRPIPVAGHDLWMLMRVATNGTPEDEKMADALLREFRLAPLSQMDQLEVPQAEFLRHDKVPLSEPLKPFGKVTYFHVLAKMLERNPVPATDLGLLARWERIGLRPGHFDEAGLTSPVQRGLERALSQGEKIVVAAQFGMATTRHGWNYSLNVGRTGSDWALVAAIARGGYGNLPEDSVYYQRTLDAEDVVLTGQNRYAMTFPAGKLPPVGAFWSLTAYDMATSDLIENSVRRYSIGDRTAGLKKNADGSLTIFLQRDPPADDLARANWLPIGDGPFYLIIRTYDPAPEIINGTWAPPQLLVR
ncbi:MAG: DUF1214 domain-containing protein [Planctomycetota bacterium]